MSFLSYTYAVRKIDKNNHPQKGECSGKQLFIPYPSVFSVSDVQDNRLRAKKGPAPPPLGNFADISYLEENFKPNLLRDVCNLCSGALVSDSLLHMLL